MTLRSVSQLLHRGSSLWTIVISIALYGLFISQVMAPQSAEVSAYAGQWGSPDGHWFYTPDTLYRELATWGDAGRQHYIDFRLGLDPVWALVYTAFLVTVTSVASRYAFAAGDPRQQLNLVALLPMLADLGENALGIVLVANFPQRLDALAWLTTSVSFSKWLTLTIAHGIMLYALGAALYQRRKNRSA